MRQCRLWHFLLQVRAYSSPWMWETWSADFGRSWGPLTRGPFPMYACMNSFITTSSGVMLIGGRYPALSVQVSFDAGMSWSLFTVDYSGTWANGGMLEIAPDRVIFMYGGYGPDQGDLRVMNLRVTRDPPLIINDHHRAGAGTLAKAGHGTGRTAADIPAARAIAVPDTPIKFNRTRLAHPTECAQPPCLKIDHIIFSIHDMLYYPMPKSTLDEFNYWVYVDVENGVKARQIAAVKSANRTTLYVQHLGMNTTIMEPCVAALGRRRCIYNVPACGPCDNNVTELYESMIAGFQQHLDDNSLVFDPETVTSELWGESYEGCVPSCEDVDTLFTRICHL